MEARKERKSERLPRKRRTSKEGDETAECVQAVLAPLYDQYSLPLKAALPYLGIIQWHGDGCSRLSEKGEDDRVHDIKNI